MKLLDLIVIISAILIIPAAPALLIYMLLPSTSNVHGPFRGLNIRLTGAFSGYFLLVLIAASISIFYLKEQKAIIAQQPKLQEWRIQSVLKVEDLGQPPKKGDFKVVLIPTDFDITGAGQNQVTLFAKVPIGIDTGADQERPVLPFRALQIEYSTGTHAPVSIFLEQEQARALGQSLEYNKDRKIINVDSLEIPKSELRNKLK
jgi:hypothetical protein